MNLDWQTQKALRQARFTLVTCAFAAPSLYAGAISMQALGGRWERFFQGLARIPWHEPRLLPVATLAVTALAGAFLLPPLLRAGSSPLAVLRMRTLLASVLLLATAICGLYTGMKLGGGAAPLAMLMLAAPPVAGFALFPTPGRWSRFLEG